MTDCKNNISEADLLHRLHIYYDMLEQDIAPVIINIARHITPVNFKESLEKPIHRWYAYKEGFSPNFVRDFITKYSDDSNDVIYDPFGGIGTTVLESAILGYRSFSTDVNPLGNFAAIVKTSIYESNDIDCIKQTLHKLSIYNAVHNVENLQNSTVVSYFDSCTYQSILEVKHFISSVKNVKVANLLKLALLSLVEVLSTHRKDGNGVKRKKISPKPVSLYDLLQLLRNRVLLYIEDINMCTIKQAPTIIDGSCISEISLPIKADIVITSPPYANCFDYSKVYMTELWMGDFFKSRQDQRDFREQSITSHVHYKWQERNSLYKQEIINDVISPLLSQKKLWSKNIPHMIGGYFADMGKFLSTLSTNLNKGATVGIVVGNSVYSGVVIATDLIIADTAKKIGYDVEAIEIYRKLTSSSQQMKIIKDTDKKYLRESLIILKWNN